MDRRTSRRQWMKAAGAAGTAAVVGCGGRGGGRPSRLPRIPATDEPLERAMADRVNQDRKKRGLPALTYQPDLAEIARYHASDMHEHRFFAHESPTTGSLDDRMAAAGFLASVARENLAEAPDVEEAEDGLLASPGHYANLMAEDITHLGVGIVRGGLADADNLLFVQVFAAPLETQSPSDAIDEALARIRAARQKAGLPPLREHPVLRAIADERVAGLGHAVAAGNLAPVADLVIADVQAANARDVQAVTVSGTLLLHAALFEPPAAVMAGDARLIGGAAAEAEDDKGRRALVILLLVGR